MHAWVDRVVDERLLVRGDRAVDVALRGFGVAEPDVRIRVEWAELDRLAVRLDRLIEEPPRLRQEEIAERLVRLRIERIELRRGAKLCGRFPSVAERGVHHAEHVGRDDEARVDLDGTRQKIDRGLVAFLVGAQRRDLAAREQLERPRHRVGRAAFSIRLTSASVSGHVERANVRDRQGGEPTEQLARRSDHRLEVRDFRSARLDLHQLRDDGQSRCRDARSGRRAPRRRGQRARPGRGTARSTRRTRPVARRRPRSI